MDSGGGGSSRGSGGPSQVATGLKADPERYARWKSAARAARLPFAKWAERYLDAAVGADLPAVTAADPELLAALDRIQDRYPVGDYAAVVRMCVIAIARSIEAGDDPFKVLRRRDAPPPVGGGRRDGR